MLLPLLAFTFGSLVVAGAAIALAGGKTATIDRRLVEVIGFRDRPAHAASRFNAVADALKRVGEKGPRSVRELGTLRRRLIQHWSPRGLWGLGAQEGPRKDRLSLINKWVLWMKRR